MVEAIDEVNSTRPSPRAAMSRSTCLARTTVDRTFRSTIDSSSSRSFSTKGPPLPTPALRAAAASGRSVAWTASHRASTPAVVRRSAWKPDTAVPELRSLAAAVSMVGSSA
jgi:hypothetical protein